jgi:nitrate reductase delta subunit
MLAPSPRAPDRLAAVVRVKAWTRARFGLGADATVFVSEVESAVPGFPPVQTVVTFWGADRAHYHFKVFKPLDAVGEDDVPPAWYRDALAVPAGGPGCSCC